MNDDRNANSISRRAFASLAAGAASARLLSAQQASSPDAPNPDTSRQRRGTMSEGAPFEHPIVFHRNDVTAKVQAFPLSQVRITGGIYKAAEDWNRGYLNRLPEDRLLHNFRINAGLHSPAAPFGGWEEPACEVRGHFTGHYLSASALLYASTGDKDAKAKGDSLVSELAKCQEKLGGGYLSAFPREFWDRLDARKPVWAPFYTIHKIMAGMFDQYHLAGNRQALDVLEGMAGWADGWTKSKSDEHMQDILNTEYGGMNEVLYNLAAVTNNDRWAQVGDRFTKRHFFNPLALRRDELRGLHVNTHIPQVIGAARRYELSGDMRFHDVADYFWQEVVNARTYATGGTSNDEGWLVPPRQLAAELKRSAATAECCCGYNMLKLTRHLFTWTGDPRYFDYYERTLLNERIGTIHPGNGHTQYYLSLTPGVYKTFNTEDQSFWCCTGTGVEEYSKLGDSIYWQDGDGLYVNLFIPSELKWAEKGLHVRQATNFPAEAGTTLTFTAETPVAMSVRIRVPGWADSGGSLKINGKTLEVLASPGSYVALRRTWRSGDQIELSLPMRLHAEPMPDDERIQAFLYGPVVLAADLGSEGITSAMTEGENVPQMEHLPAISVPVAEFAAARTIAAHGDEPERHIPAQAIPTLRAAGADPNTWIQPDGGPLAFRTTGQEKDLALKPLHSLFEKRYTVYFQVS